MTRFTLRRRVEFADTDMAGIVHFTAYFRYLEAAEHALLRSLGLSLFDAGGAARLDWPRVSASFDYRAPLRFDDEFDVRLRMQRLGQSSVTYRGEIVREGVVVAVGRATVVCCRVGKGGTLRAVRIPARVRALLAGTGAKAVRKAAPTTRRSRRRAGSG
ncbi:MAG: thioesterase family protein [Verrucomicrobia bacterium]|nr:thioesterase family protein [Verrucomicrobiota bacterium]